MHFSKMALLAGTSLVLGQAHAWVFYRPAIPSALISRDHSRADAPNSAGLSASVGSTVTTPLETGDGLTPRDADPRLKTTVTRTVVRQTANPTDTMLASFLSRNPLGGWYTTTLTESCCGGGMTTITHSDLVADLSIDDSDGEDDGQSHSHGSHRPTASTTTALATTTLWHKPTVTVTVSASASAKVSASRSKVPVVTVHTVVTCDCGAGASPAKPTSTRSSTRRRSTKMVYVIKTSTRVRAGRSPRGVRTL